MQQLQAQDLCVTWHDRASQCTFKPLGDSTAGAVQSSVRVRMPQHGEVLVLTHELASIEEIMPYHSIRLSPMPCVEMVGRSRALEPPRSRDASVYFW